MIRGELDFLRGAQQTSSEFSRLKAQFAQGINWEGAEFLKAPPAAIDRINAEAAANLMRLKRHLGLPSYPEIRLLQDWSEVLPEEERLMAEIFADAIVDDNNPNGRIRISPSVIKAAVTGVINADRLPVLFLAGLLAHEKFHIWQYKNTPEKVKRDTAIRSNSKPDSWIEAWSYTETEREALAFQRHWIEFGHTY